MATKLNRKAVKAAAIKLFNENGRDGLAALQAAERQAQRANQPEDRAFWQLVAQFCWDQNHQA